MMKLYTVPLAPNPTKVMLYIAEREEAGQPMGIEQIIVNTLKGRHKEPEHLARNPFGTLPVLELEDGSYLLESLSIMTYLEDRFAEGGLLGGSPEERARARDLERIVDIRFAMPAGAYVHAVNSPLGLPPDPQKAASLEKEMRPALDFLESRLADGRPLLTGEQVSIADCTLAAALQFLRFAKADLLPDYPGIRSWDERYRQRPAGKNILQW